MKTGQMFNILDAFFNLFILKNIFDIQPNPNVYRVIVGCIFTNCFLYKIRILNFAFSKRKGMQNKLSYTYICFQCFKPGVLRIKLRLRINTLSCSI